MKLRAIGIRRYLQVSSILIILGLLVEIVTLLWFHPLSFVFFIFVGVILIGVGILVYLISLVFVVSGPEGEGLPDTYTLFGQVASGMSVVDKINAQGSTAGVPPDVTQRMISVTIQSS